MNSPPASTQHKEIILRIVTKALLLIPKTRPDDLPPHWDAPDVPDWHSSEFDLWPLGEDVRQAMNKKTTLRGDEELYSHFLKIVQDRAGMRGRQSWVLLFAYKSCSQWAAEIADLLPDPDIDGHVVSALYKMKAHGFREQVAPLLNSKFTWIRKEAERYIQFDQNHD